MARQALESDRQRLLAIERLILETICFNFTSKMPFPLVIKFGRYFNGPFFPSALRVCRPHTTFLSSLEAVDEIRVAACGRRLPNSRTADVPTSRRGVGMPLSCCSINFLRKTSPAPVSRTPATGDVTDATDSIIDAGRGMGGSIQHRCRPFGT